TGVKANRTYRTVSPGWESSVDCGLAKPAASGAAGYLAGLLRAHKRNAPTDYASKLEAQAAGSSPGWVATIRTGCTLPEGSTTSLSAPAGRPIRASPTGVSTEKRAARAS